VVSSSDLSSNFWDCTLDYCPTYHEPWFGGTMVVRNVGSAPQRVHFNVNMVYRPNGTVVCSFVVNQTIADRRIANGDDVDVPGEDTSLPAPAVAPGSNVKVFLDDDHDATGTCVRADHIKLTPMILLPTD
jgi:hypothetical protein